MEEKLMDKHALAEMLAMSEQTIRKRLREGSDFPQPISFGPKIKRWRYSDVLNWIESKDETNV